MRGTLAGVGMMALVTGSMSLGFAAQTDSTVKDFLATCAETSTHCLTVMMGAELRAQAAHDYCPPSELTQPDDMRVAVIKWLKQRPEMLADDKYVAIRAALKALYCH